MFVDFFIHRPVFATVCALLIILAGAICVPNLPVAMYPSLAPPVVEVNAVYVGADAQTVEKAVTIPLEEAINGVEGMRYISSSSTNAGISSIDITFQTGYNLDIAAVDVQNRVASAEGRLPGEVLSTGITVLKSNYNFVFGAGFFTLDGRYSSEYISNYLDIYVKDALKRVPGVGDVVIFGERKYAMRVWLDPIRMAARGLTASDVVNALTEQNVEIPAGSLGEPPSNSTQAFQIPVRVTGRLTNPDEFNNLIVKYSPNGLVLLKDVGHAEIGAESYGNLLEYQGHQAMGIGVEQLSNANSLDVDRRAKAELDRLSKNFPPGLLYAVAFDSTTAVGQSIREVLVTLAEAIIIVITVIFLFLLDWRATIIPAVTIPVSLIGTFAFIRIFNFSINSLTLFGITLATGLVVDDAIVVIENVQRHIHMEHSDPHEATSRAMSEVTSAVIATSLVLIAVFVPVSFFPGTTGILYRQFALTIAFSIAISAFNALTLSPALSALVLRGEEARPRQLDFLHIRLISRAFAAFIHGADAFITWMASTYARIIHVALQLRYLLLLVFFAGLGATVWIYGFVPTGFIPQEDAGYFMVIVQAPPGSSLSYTTSLSERGAAIIKQDPDVIGLFSIIGFSFAGSASNQGMMFVSTTAATKSAEKGHTTANIVRDLTPKLQALMFMPNGGLVQPFEPPAVEGVGSLGGFQFMLQDQGGNSLTDLDRVAHQIVAASGTHKELVNLFTSFSANDPQELVTIDRDKAKTMGVSISQIATTLSVFMGSEYINDFDYNDRTYRVFVQADRPFRMTAGDLHSYYVRADSGQMVPLDNLVTVADSAGAPVITRYNLFRSVEIDGSAAPGYSSGQAIAGMEKLAQANMMRGMGFQWTGLTLDEIESSGEAIIIFALGIVVVYLTLSAQYESFALPFIILLAVPMAVLGALGLVSLRGFANDVYCQIGLVMLIGLSAKNSILIVEFAEQLRRKGRTIAEAAIEAAELRLRPILMTSFAFILGVLPLVFATGAGSQGRKSVGTTIVGGMLLSTVLNLVFIPVLYVILSRLLRRDKSRGEAQA
ncbi:Efflux pump membrane transporter BepE [Candidatus Sulfotelmatomonas gaucii]|uniref:Efflux pump membrane transporter BepE n=1 Tax=Candidatus Sulfuritelmatomonas gaucii TaxID=2043161 RepID=A0A2N9LL40_9BACT|nr:Efflux pump membrane transporter BepE [Candidatus Sulfotelmatomonas gaucii]